MKSLFEMRMQNLRESYKNLEGRTAEELRAIFFEEPAPRVYADFPEGPSIWGTGIIPGMVKGYTPTIYIPQRDKDK